MSVSRNLTMVCVKEMMDGIPPILLQGMAIIGFLYLVRCAFCLLGGLYATFLRPGKNLKRYGEWAIVTGATGELEHSTKDIEVQGKFNMRVCLSPFLF